jgi:galactose mutarotase-like enzyme
MYNSIPLMVSIAKNYLSERMDALLENEDLKIVINPKGAELKSVVNKHTGLEYMWSGDPAYWGKTSPILFPIVGALKNGSYLFDGKSYSLTRHGFAREEVFQIEEQQDDRIVFALTSTPALQEKYPFDFVLLVKYQLVADQLNVTYEVKNNDDQSMYFSIGGHPAFKVPLVNGTTYEEYYLQFDRMESAGRWPVSPEGLIKNQPVPFLKDTSTLKLTHELFKEDALVFKNLQSTKISIRSDVHQHGLDFSFKGFPYLGLWAAKNADFVCIEPWCGIADSESHNGQLVSKEGIVRLARQDEWSCSWKVRFY